jgi:hypothetical protein
LTTLRWEEKGVLARKCSRSTGLFVFCRFAGRTLGTSSTAIGEELVAIFMIERRFMLRLPMQRKPLEQQPLIK